VTGFKKEGKLHRGKLKGGIAQNFPKVVSYSGKGRKGGDHRFASKGGAVGSGLEGKGSFPTISFSRGGGG